MKYISFITHALNKGKVNGLLILAKKGRDAHLVKAGCWELEGGGDWCESWANLGLICDVFEYT